MQLAALQRWHWIAIAIVVGLTIGLVRDSAQSELYGLDMNGYGMLMTDQAQFENGLVRNYNGIPLFSDSVVYPHRTKSTGGKSELVYIVCGRYWDGQQQTQNGKTVAEWLPRCIITPTPYRPTSVGVSEGNAAAVSEYPSVVEYLAALHRAYGVNYRYAWWAAHPVLTWLVGCLIVIGGIWPTLINLLAFGAFTRPAHVKPISLWNIRKPAKPGTPAAPAINFSGGDGDAADLTAPTPAPAGASGSDQAIAKLAAEQIEAVEIAQSDTEFGAKDDDYYPTERRGGHNKSDTAKPTR